MSRGERIADRYELCTPIGHSAMGEVWERTEARRKGAAFALRCLSPDADPGELSLETRSFWQTPQCATPQWQR
ncbi:hypothetical protein ACFZC6_15350 [Streptomyces ossamyceticus]|jgi:hypothetical protein|uniref:Serine/threonine protein kinase n=1 Tax=Streptomyces ossamyceticus TaxID=249581 RepID=A0ABV2V0R8_9ACTN